MRRRVSTIKPGIKSGIVVDIAPLLEDRWTGIPIFTRRLVQALLRDGSLDVEFSYQLARIPAPLVWATLRAGTGTLLRDAIAHGVATEGVVDPHKKMLFPSKKETCGVFACAASTVHDLSTLVMPECHEAANVRYHMRGFQKELDSDAAIFCASQATQAALHTHFASVRSKTRVLYQYVDWPDEFAALEANLPPLKLGRYAVVIGTLEPRKNLALLLRALSLPEIERSDLRFVVIGKKGWKVDQFLNELDDDHKRRLVFSGFVSEFSKYRLLRGAEFLVYPSVYEGFGVPALEAMSLGKPVLAALTSSLPEVIEDAGVFFDPLSAADFAMALAEISHKRKLKALCVKATKRAAAFDWQRMAAPVVQWANE